MAAWPERSKGLDGKLLVLRRKGEYNQSSCDGDLTSSWGELCPMRFSAAIDAFHLLPPASQSYSKYADALIQIAKAESATLFIPVSGAGSSVEDARAAETMSTETKGRCRTFIQDPGTMLDLHDKDRFMDLVDKLGFTIPSGKMIGGVNEGIEYLRGVGEKKFVLKCMGLDENRGDMTLFPVSGDGKDLAKTRKVLEGLTTKITKECPYVFQEYIPGPGEYTRSIPPMFPTPLEPSHPARLDLSHLAIPHRRIYLHSRFPVFSLLNLS